MDKFNISNAFLKDAAAKHFVVLTYHARVPGQTESVYHASCFVILAEGIGFLVTAGHIIAEMQSNMAAGVTYSKYRLQDRRAGNVFPSIPYDFNLDEWIVIHGDENGTDYAVAPLSGLVASNLAVGGIEPLGENTWGKLPFEQYPVWLLVGIPSETHSIEGGQHRLKLVLLPLTPTECPPDLLNPPVNKILAKIVEQPGLDSVTINDIAGMSGGPIFGVQKDDVSARYWAIGIQSSWLPKHRIVCFCPLPDFLAGLKGALQTLRQERQGKNG